MGETDMQKLREQYLSYLQCTGKSKNTAFTTANEIFNVWKSCGEEFFWNTVHADKEAQRENLTIFLESHYPKQLKYLSGYMTSFKYFQEFLASGKNDSAEFMKEPDASMKKEKSGASITRQPVLRLTEEMLEEEHRKVLADPGYGTDYALLESVLRRFPKNTDPEIVALKIALIDMTNSTNIGRQRQKIVVTELASIITGIQDFDARIQQGDLSVVPIIAKSNGSINLFSFASKYCTYHAVDVYDNDAYVIFDSVLKNALPKYVPGLHESTVEEWRRKYNYDAYVRCIDDLLDANGISIPFRHRKLDHFLWHTYK